MSGRLKLPETIEWFLLSDGPPDADMLVLMSWDQSQLTDWIVPDEPERGWLDADGWHLAESGAVVDEAPTWWAEWPSGPQGAV